ncbi:MAG: hypothetical protein J4432_02020 [DPANN group archaeon]|nr:hypothetical protein [DPANN group archaeon]
MWQTRAQLYKSIRDVVTEPDGDKRVDALLRMDQTLRSEADEFNELANSRVLDDAECDDLIRLVRQQEVIDGLLSMEIRTTGK